MTNTVLLMPGQAASLIGVPVTNLAHWRHQHRDSFYVGFGRVVRYRLAAIGAWILTHEIQPGDGLPDPIDDGGASEFPDLGSNIVYLGDFQPNAGGT